MFKRKLPLILSLASVAILSGCKHSSTSNRVAYSTQPAVVATPAAVAVPVQPPCATPCPSAGAVPPPPAGFIR
jgi:hypothetical protein